MEIFDNIFKLVAGVGLFLFGMYLLEESLKNLTGRNLKLFLQRATKNKVGAIAGGAIVTAILQSSSVVSLMVLAFVGAGVFTMKNALAIILGANLGTTLDSWVVATLGFKVNIEIAAYPAVFIGGLLLMLFGERKSMKYFSYFLFGFGLLFIGLAFMKTSMEVEMAHFDFSKYSEMSLFVFLGIGFMITLLVQSSSVTMALTLSALHAGVITFPPAAAIVLGSETGTTIKIMLSAIGGTAPKRRLALGNLLFNVFLTIVTFTFIHVILSLITDVFKISDPLIGLVIFSSLINLLSILIFIPFLDPFTKFLERFFKNIDSSNMAFISHMNTSGPSTLLDLFRKETEYFIYNSMIFNISMFEIDISLIDKNPEFKGINERRKFYSKADEQKYEYQKQSQGELQAYYLKLRVNLHDEENRRLDQLISAVRSSMHSVKSIKDIRTDISNLNRSSKDIKYNSFIHHKKETEILYQNLYALIEQPGTANFEKLQQIHNDIEKNYTSALLDFYKDAGQASVEDLDLTIIINFNRELFTSNKAILMAVKEFLLDEKEAKEFNEIPVYKT